MVISNFILYGYWTNVQKFCEVMKSICYYIGCEKENENWTCNHYFKRQQ